VCFLSVGCAPELFPTDATTLLPSNPLSPIASTGTDDEDDADQNPAASIPSAEPISASVAPDDYVLLRLPGGSAGLKITFARQMVDFSSLVVAVFDENMNLLSRGVLGPTGSLDHTLRTAAGEIVLGLSSASDTTTAAVAGTVRYSASTAPAPNRQIVYLDFGPAGNVQIHTKPPIDLAAFSADALGTAYVGQTAYMHDLIVAAVRADYADFDVEIVSSIEAGPPIAPFSTVYVGGRGDGLLGLADAIDRYNRDVTESAIVYAETFSIYQRMNLSTEEMAAMIANTISHELGHLLGLYHTAAPGDVMDTTASVWELTENQSFSRVPLYHEVFPAGFEDCPALLGVGVGWLPAASARKADLFQRPADSTTLLSFRRVELPGRCGTCLGIEAGE
jgi:hypothetical protein